MKYFVEIVRSETDGVVKTMGPFSEKKADKIEGGININLNHEVYFTRVIVFDCIKESHPGLGCGCPGCTSKTRRPK